MSTGDTAWLSLSAEDREAAEAVGDLRDAVARGERAVHLPGSVLDDLTVDVDRMEALLVDASVHGSLIFVGGGPCDVVVTGRIHGDIVVNGVISTLQVRGSVDGSLFVPGEVTGFVNVSGRVVGTVSVLEPWPDEGTPAGVVRSNIVLQGGVGAVDIGGVLGGELLVVGAVDRLVVVSGQVAESVTLYAPASGGIAIPGEVGGALEIGSEQPARIVVLGQVGQGIRLLGRFAEGVSLSPLTTSRCDLTSVSGARFDRPLHIGDGVSIAGCDFRQCADLDRLDLIGADLFTLPDGTPAKELTKPEGASDGEMASIYRQLRVNLEGKGNRPASAFFYRGEMDSRRRAAWRQRRWGEWTWIGLYRVVAGYGLAVAPPLLWFGALVGLGGWAFHALDVGRDWPATFVYTAQSMLSLFRPPDPSNDWRIGLLQVVLRLVGPILLGLAAFAVRDKVAR